MTKNSANKTDVAQGAPTEEAKGVQLLLNQSSSAYSKLPMLEVICDKFIRLASGSMRNYMADMVDIKMVGITSTRFGDYMANCSNSIIGLFKASSLNNIGLLTIESKLVYSMVDILFGGRKVPPVLKVEDRPFTSIETGIARNISELILTELGNSFEQVMHVNFELERLETNQKFAMVLRPEDNVVAIELEVILDQRSGHLTVLLPYITLDPIKKLLAKSYTAASGHKDPAWVSHLETEVARSQVKVEVSLHGKGIIFGQLAELKVGQTIMLDKPSDCPCNLILNGNTIASVALGCVGENVAVTMLTDGIKMVQGGQE
ncbi:MAG: FliM/FliN family flagellar motor switch protein [Proteobacteria bacterium]|nr:FliM/FliN family flagellar motor switch protein [Pseudomonadota bacterium]